MMHIPQMQGLTSSGFWFLIKELNLEILNAMIKHPTYAHTHLCMCVHMYIYKNRWPTSWNIHCRSIKIDTV